MLPMPRIIGVPWFHREDYPLILKICQGEFPSTFDEWEQMAQQRFDRLVAEGAPLEKVMIDPEKLASFSGDREIDASIRAEFAAFTIAHKYNRDH